MSLQPLKSNRQHVIKCFRGVADNRPHRDFRNFKKVNYFRIVREVVQSEF